MVDLSMQSGVVRAAPLKGRVHNFFASFAPEWRYARIVLLGLALWYLTAMVAHLYLGAGSRTSMADTKWLNADVWQRLAEFMFVLGIVRFVQFRKRTKDISLFKAMAQAVKPRPTALLRWVLWACLAIASFAIFLSNIMSLKTTIPEFIPFYFDNAAKSFDRFIFFGHDAWELVAPLYQVPGLVRLIDTLYSVIWAVVLSGCWFYCFSSKAMDRTRRYQFCLALIILFVGGGNFLAIIFSSVGPIYYQEYVGGSDFVGLSHHLAEIGHNVPLMAVQVQERLLNMSQDAASPINGISAVPSMHIGTTCLILLLFWRTPLARMVTLVFAVFIAVGSVLLGWHYALDGLMAVPLAILSWRAAGWILRKYASETKAKI